MALRDRIKRKLSEVIDAVITGVSGLVEKLLGFLNRSLYDRIMWITILDNRTCPTCGVLSGKVWPLDASSLFTHPTPPRHLHCRCSLTLIKRFAKVPSQPTFEDWLRDQDSATVEEVLGKKKARLFVEGELKLDRFVDETGDVLTLDELRLREAALWKEIAA